MVSSYEPERIEKEIDRVIENGIQQEHRETMRLFVRYCKLRDLKAISILMYLTYLKSFCKAINRPFDQMTKEDIENFLLSIKDRPEKTKGNFKTVIKKFFKWYYKTEDGYPEIVRWIKASVKNARIKMPEDLLTQKEVLTLADKSDNLRDKALILTLYDSACRISEIMNLKIKDIQSDSYGIILTVNGKTGMRKIRLLTSVNTLVLWLNNHPCKNEPESYVFCSMNRASYGQKMTAWATTRIVKRLAIRIGMKKRIHPHLFRHSRLTELSKKGYPESFMRQFAGWTAKSTMPEIYIHLSAKNIDDMMLTKEGLMDSKKELIEELKPVNCPRCSESNSATNKYCFKCAMPLDEESIRQIESENRIKNAIMSNPKIMEMIQQDLKA